MTEVQMPPAKTKKPRYSEEMVRKHLSWLAWQMKQHDQSVFMVENLQPDWLMTGRQRWMYIIKSRFIGALLISCLVGLILTVILWLHELEIADAYQLVSMRYLFLESLLYHLVTTIFYGLVLGITFIVVEILSAAKIFREIRPWVLIASYFVLPLLLLLPFPLSEEIDLLQFGVFERLIRDHDFAVSYAYLDIEPSSFSYWERYLAVGLLISLILCVPEGVRRRNRSMALDIATVDTLKWSWKDTWHAGIGLLLGGIADLLNSSLLYTPILGFTFGLFGGATAGLRPMKTKPNQGITLSLRNVFFVGLGCIIIALMAWVYFFYMRIAQTGGFLTEFLASHNQRSYALDFATFYLFFVLYVVMFKYGLLDVVYHYTLRWSLYKKGYLPLRLVPLLDYAANQLNFLQKVGGGYIFVHRYLLEHFAKKEEANS